MTNELVLREENGVLFANFLELVDVRCVIEDENIFFNRNDLCDCLGIKKYANATEVFDEDERVSKKMDTLGGEQEMTFVTESGLYRLIAKSQNKNEKVLEFKRWMFKEVIPSIRKYGIYGTPKTIEALLNDPDWGITLLKEIKKEREEKELLKLENEKQQLKIEEDKPKVELAEAVIETGDNIKIGIFAKQLGKIGPNNLFNLLRNEKYFYYENGYNLPFQQYIDAGYFVVKKRKVDSLGRIVPLILITIKGQQHLINKFNNRGIKKVKPYKNYEYYFN